MVRWSVGQTGQPFKGMVLQNLVRDCQEPGLHAPNHNPAFFVDESALVVGIRAMAMMAVNFLASEE